MLNFLDYVLRVLMLGDYMVYMNYIKCVYDVFFLIEYGFGVDDVNCCD